MPLGLVNNLGIIFRGDDTFLLPRVSRFYACNSFFHVLPFSGIEILLIGSVVRWTKNMGQNLPFCFALSIFLSRNSAMFASGSALIQHKSLRPTFGEINVSA